MAEPDYSPDSTYVYDPDTANLGVEDHEQNMSIDLGRGDSGMNFVHEDGAVLPSTTGGHGATVGVEDYNTQESAPLTREDGPTMSMQDESSAASEEDESEDDE